MLSTCAGAKIAAVALLLLWGTMNASATTYISAHSHWDVAVVGKNTSVAISEITNLPHREQDAQNNMELRTHTDGFRLVKRINGVASELNSTLTNPGLTFG